MISRMMTPFDWNRPVFTLDGHGQEIATPTPLGTIDIAVYFDAQIIKQNPQYAEATHIGLTKDKTVQQHDTIGAYTVLHANPIGRYNQVILKEV